MMSLRPPRDSKDPLITLVIRRMRMDEPELKEANDDVVGLDKFYDRNYERLIKHQRTNALSPSATTTFAWYRSTQGKEFPIYDGRHPESRGMVSSTLAMPVSLYHVFAKYLLWMSDQSLRPLRSSFPQPPGLCPLPLFCIPPRMTANTRFVAFYGMFLVTRFVPFAMLTRWKRMVGQRLH
ncbi:hypothetical protein BJ138DRAFT_325808 [Hygrophoropsis aurantiaca]|uniref:Uncharacterized protein n=1 Tax=Hygrophoropsis aurantiaca TaxID=72124 RepID=A0ACB8A6M8_9AGAM|nr:hypothetical protein BJ138DRAFT_325808 [Hygrophoropsis aurantiaca]